MIVQISLKSLDQRKLLHHICEQEERRDKKNPDITGFWNHSWRAK